MIDKLIRNSIKLYYPKVNRIYSTKPIRSQSIKPSAITFGLINGSYSSHFYTIQLSLDYTNLQSKLKIFYFLSQQIVKKPTQKKNHTNLYHKIKFFIVVGHFEDSIGVEQLKSEYILDWLDSGDNIMLDPQRKQAAFCSRANYQLREIENVCRQVTSMAKHLNTFASDVAASDLNSKKVEILKSQIKDKLRQYAASMDSIYQVLDRKIQLILAELKRIDGRCEQIPPTPTCKKCHSLNTTSLTKEPERQMSFENQFSETLNPRIAHLQSKISQYQANEIKLKGKIAELQVKNESLLEEFNRLSTASNKKINELNSKISKDRPEVDSLSHSPSKQTLNSSPSLQFSPNKPKKINNMHYETQQFSYNLSHEMSYTTNPNQREDKTQILNFGCMPTRLKGSGNSLRGSKTREECEKLDRSDRNRRFDLLLNKLRDTQQESTDESHTEELRRMDDHTSYMQSPVRRFQI